jgi:hypothetical protein
LRIKKEKEEKDSKTKLRYTTQISKEEQEGGKKKKNYIGKIWSLHGLINDIQTRIKKKKKNNKLN